MTDAKETQVVHYEGSPWFWKLFGGTLISVVALLLLTHVTTINANMNSSFLDLKTEMKELRASVSEQRDRVTAVVAELNSVRTEVAVSEKNVAAVQATTESAKSASAANQAGIEALKEELKVLRDEAKEMQAEVKQLRDKLVAAEATKQAESPAPVKP